jgi:hypothetical protein
MYLGIPRPLPERLALVPENGPRQTPENDQTHVCHDWGNISTLDNPRGDKLRKPIAPYVLVDCDSHEYGTGDRFIRVDGIRRGDGWQSGDLNTSTGVSYDYNDLLYQRRNRHICRCLTFQSQWC